MLRHLDSFHDGVVRDREVILAQRLGQRNRRGCIIDLMSATKADPESLVSFVFSLKRDAQSSVRGSLINFKRVRIDKSRLNAYDCATFDDNFTCFVRLRSDDRGNARFYDGSLFRSNFRQAVTEIFLM